MISLFFQGPLFNPQLTEQLAQPSDALDSVGSSINATGYAHPKEVLAPVQYRPSPVKFTSQRPEQFPVKPKPERVPPGAHSHHSNQSKIDNHSVGTPPKNGAPGSTETQPSILSLETLRDFTDFGKEEVMSHFLPISNDSSFTLKLIHELLTNH